MDACLMPYYQFILEKEQLSNLMDSSIQINWACCPQNLFNQLSSHVKI